MWPPRIQEQGGSRRVGGYGLRQKDQMLPGGLFGNPSKAIFNRGQRLSVGWERIPLEAQHTLCFLWMCLPVISRGPSCLQSDGAPSCCRIGSGPLGGFPVGWKERKVLV